MGSGPVFAKQRIEDAKKLAHIAYEQMVKEVAENRLAYESFYNNLALFSGGTIVLSVTYLGYLKSGPATVSNPWVIVICWGCLLICLVSALFRNFFNIHYAHYARQREYHEKLESQYETESKELPQIPAMNPDDLHSYLAALEKAAIITKESVAWSGRREKLYEFLWFWNSRVAYFMFPVGLLFLIVFAVLNL